MDLVDADGHVIESEANWQYLEPEYYPRRPVPVTVPTDTSLGDWNAFWLVDGQMHHFGAVPATGQLAAKKSVSIPSQELTDVSARLEDLDKAHISKQVLHPSTLLAPLPVEPELEGALLRSRNTFMAEQCSTSDGRLWFDVLVPFRDPEAAVSEIKRVVPLGQVASILMGGIEWDMPLNDPSFRPIFAEAERHDLPVVVHLRAGSPTINAMFSGMTRIEGEKPFFPPRARELVAELVVQYGLYALLQSPLVHEFPNLRWAFLEGGGCEWVVSARTLLARTENKELDRLLSEGRLFFGCEPDDDIPYVSDKIGADCLVVGSDMPHFDAAQHDDPIEEYTSRGDLSDGLLKKILSENANRLYGF